jgi:hypothetical protein
MRCAGGRRPATQLLTIAGKQATTKRAVDKSKQQPTNACWRQASNGLRKEQRAKNRGKAMPTRRTSVEEEDYYNNKEEDYAAASTAASAAAAAAAAVAAATAPRRAPRGSSGGSTA